MDNVPSSRTMPEIDTRKVVEHPRVDGGIQLQEIHLLFLPGSGWKAHGQASVSVILPPPTCRWFAQAGSGLYYKGRAKFSYWRQAPSCAIRPDPVSWTNVCLAFWPIASRHVWQTVSRCPRNQSSARQYIRACAGTAQTEKWPDPRPISMLSELPFPAMIFIRPL